MRKENSFFAMKSIFIALMFSFLIVSQICGDENIEGSNREKRAYNDQLYTAPNNYESNSYPGGSYDSNYQPVICKTPPKCLPFDAIPNQGDPVKTNGTWLALPRTFYVPIGSCYGYSLFAKLFLGRDVQTEHELSEMCTTQFFSGTAAYIDGYGRRFMQNCVPSSDNFAQVCTTIPNSGSEGTDLSFQNVEVDYLVLTNGKNFALVYRCVDNRYADYMLYTIQPFVERSDAVEIVDTILQMGFDSKDIRFLTCKPPTYPHPFENYLPGYNNPTCSASPFPYQDGKSGSQNNDAYKQPPAYNNHGNPYGNPDSYHYPPSY